MNINGSFRFTPDQMVTNRTGSFTSKIQTKSMLSSNIWFRFRCFFFFFFYVDFRFSLIGFFPHRSPQERQDYLFKLYGSWNHVPLSQHQLQEQGCEWAKRCLALPHLRLSLPVSTKQLSKQCYNGHHQEDFCHLKRGQPAKSVPHWKILFVLDFFWNFLKVISEQINRKNLSKMV